MMTSNLIKTLALVSEIAQPMVGEKFHNSDKPWEEAILGKNPGAMNVAFSVTASTFEAANSPRTEEAMLYA